MSNVRPHVNSPSRRAKRALGVAICYLLVLGGCSSSRQSVTNGRVEYRGSALLVGGVEYLEDPRAEDHQPGAVLIFPTVGEAGSVQYALTQLGLRATLQGSAPGWFLVAVPEGFETQWLAALRNLPGVASAHLNVRGRLL
jgi:hypothetical protein